MEIKILKLTLENFKCHKHLTLDFGGGDRTIYGDNAAGKTSVYDAFAWLLFGKDSLGNANPDIKPLDADGNVADHLAITAVEAELEADGQVVILRRTLREIWTTRRGSAEQEFGGHTSDFAVDGVPMKKNAYDEQIRQLVPEELFRMLTSVSWFPAGMGWQERRAILFDMTESLEDQEIMKRDERFAPLLEGMGRLSLEDYKRKIQAQQRSLTDVRDDVPSRINECENALEDLEGMDFDEAREQESRLQADLEAAQRDLAALDNNSAISDLELRIREAQMEKKALEAENRQYRREQESRQPDTASLERQIREQEALGKGQTLNIRYTKQDIEDLSRKLEQAREEWSRVNAETFTDKACPTCGQTLPPQKQAAARRRFEEDQKRRLDRIQDTAAAYKLRIQSLEERLAEHSAAADSCKDRIGALQLQLEQVKADRVPVGDLEDYAPRMFRIMENLSEAQKQRDQLKAGYLAAAREREARVRQIQDQLALVRRVLAQEAVRERTLQRIEMLREDARNAAQALEAIEKQLWLMKEFVRYKAQALEDSVNIHFRLAAFRLFRRQANGGLEERCDVVVDGVPYGSLNNGMRINAGIDIINALSLHYGVRVPLFIDNAEAVTRLELCGSQVIRLVVSEGDQEVRLV